MVPVREHTVRDLGCTVVVNITDALVHQVLNALALEMVSNKCETCHLQSVMRLAEVICGSHGATVSDRSDRSAGGGALWLSEAIVMEVERWGGRRARSRSDGVGELGGTVWGRRLPE